MKRCLQCQKSFSGEDWKCPACGYQPGQVGNFISFAPELAAFNEHCPPDSFERLAPVEKGHFWFETRSNLIAWALRKCFSTKGKFLEIGCGNGFVLSRIERDFPQLELHGAEIYLEGLRFSSQRLQRADLIQMNALAIPYREEFDLIGMFDTLEHIREDEAVLAQVHQALVPGGGLLLTVPQHPFLWSYLDEFSGHARRYKRKELAEKLRKSGFQVVTATSFVFFFLPALWLLRMGKRKNGPGFNPAGELRLSPLVNAVLRLVLSLECLLIRAGLRLPWGGTLLLIARKV